jgi:hypothetical protein
MPLFEQKLITRAFFLKNFIIIIISQISYQHRRDMLEYKLIISI